MAAPVSHPSARRNDDAFLSSHHLATRALLDAARRLASQATPVLLLGESGSGRGAVARHLHACGAVPDSPFVSLDCAGLESLQFVEKAGLGTALLREIGDLAPRLQEPLRQLLESGRLQLRVIASAGPDLAERCERGLFSRALLDVFDAACLRVPPLRDRMIDLPDLVDGLLAERGSSMRIGEAVMGHLVEYDWPGNVAELELVVDRLCAGGGEVAAADDLPPQIRWFPGGVAAAPSFDPLDEGFQLRLIADALRRTHRR